jgi:oligopeptidase B
MKPIVALVVATISVVRQHFAFTFMHLSHRHQRAFNFNSINSGVSNDLVVVPKPPIAFRNNSAFVLVGQVDDDNATLRQHPSSTHPLLSPPRAIPDPYGWMKDETRTNATVLAHLHAENEYTRQMTQHLEPLQEKLYQEILSHMHETDHSPPTAMGDYWYYTRIEKGVSYPRSCRAPRNKDDVYPPPINKNWCEPDQHLLPGEQVILDVPSIARGKSYMAVGSISTSPNQEYVAFSLDETGDEMCHFHVRKIATGEEWILYDHTGQNTLEGYGKIEWDGNSSGIFYVVMDETQRPYRVFYRQLFRSDGSVIDEHNKQKDELIYEEKDTHSTIHIKKTFDGKYLLVSSDSAESNTIRYLDLQPQRSSGVPTASDLVCISNENSFCSITHCKGYWLALFIEGGQQRLKACIVGKESNERNWRYMYAINAEGFCGGDGGDQPSFNRIKIFTPPSCESKSNSKRRKSNRMSNRSSNLLAYCVITGREQGLPRVWVLELKLSKSLKITKITRLEFTETAFVVSIGPNLDCKLPYVVISYESPVTPMSQIAVPLADPDNLAARVVIQEMTVPLYDKDQYKCERTAVKSRCGNATIPVTLVYRRDALLADPGNVPVHLNGYGSYGDSFEAVFPITGLPLLNRGFVIAIAHVRGGGEMGRQWHRAPSGAELLCKKRSFDDFVDVARWLTEDKSGITNPTKLSCQGRSAGGLLIGAAINQAPELFHAAILNVPFVDVLCTLSDSTIPLTTSEWIIWGNPNEARYFQYIAEYSPINNIQNGKVYPACLLTGGINDPRVQFWESAKFTAELRHSASRDSGNVLLKTDMIAGHFAGQDRYKSVRERSFEYSFLLDGLELV